MALVVRNKAGLTVPEATLKQAGIRPGDLIEFAASRGAVTIRHASDEKRFGTYVATKAEAAAIRKGRAAIKRGEFVTLDELLHDLDHPRRQARRKRTKKGSP